MYEQNYQENYQIYLDGLACRNDKPITCYSGITPGAVMMGWTVAQYLEDTVGGTRAAIALLDKLQEEAGPVRTLNYAPMGENPAMALPFLWNSRILFPGKDLPENSTWQVKERCLVGPEAYDEILAEGYGKYSMTKILPQVMDLDAFFATVAKNAPYFPEMQNEYIKRGIIVIRGNFEGVQTPFESLCGMRSMNKFFMDCYKKLDKLKAVSDLMFEESYAATEEKLIALESDPYALGTWIGGWRTASAMVNPKIWETLVWPYMKKSAEQLIRHGKIAIMHLDQNWDRDIERFSELPEGKYILNTDGMTDLRATRKKLPKAALMGDVPPTLLTTGTPEQVADYVTRLIDDVGPQGLFVCPGCDCPVNAKFENLAAMVKATNEWH